ncbi:acyl carrier protein [Clostridium fungisolvens]|uniref:Acyl carrier protein n=1 Tax=Clostridium fungisolvens TaxID=1604897 RepID=A0A6V8SLW8_9CLOT|nr:phosphopantetheine-binding protein [Clostridium fungisolvens]GFP77741.1 Acyl carrier protein [Clostridium fungisolvens]
MNEKEQKIADRLREILVTNLRLPMNAEDIDYEEELFNSDLGLDSVDSLEIVAAIDDEYGVSLTSEHREYFKNIRTLSEIILRSIETA